MGQEGGSKLLDVRSLRDMNFMCAWGWGWQKTIVGAFSQAAFTFCLRQSLSSLEGAKWTWPAGPQTPGILLLPPPQCWDYQDISILSSLTDHSLPLPAPFKLGSVEGTWVL